jgi:CBS domain-containing protein
MIMKAKIVKDLRPYNTAAIVSEDMALKGMVQLFVEHPELHSLCVVDDAGNLLGLIDRIHLFQAIFSHQVPASSMVKKLYYLLTSEQASDLLVKHVHTCKETDSLDDVINRMISSHLDAIPVVRQDGKLEGIIDVERLFKEWLKQEKPSS